MVCSVNGQLHTRPRSLALALFGEMIFSLKLYESGPKAWREVGGPWRIRMTNRFSNRFSFSVLSFYAKQFFCLSWFRSCDVLKGLWSLSFVNDAECHYESTGVGVGVFFTLETGRTLSHKLEGIGDSRIKTFPFSSHFTWLRRFRSSEKWDRKWKRKN